MKGKGSLRSGGIVKWLVVTAVLGIILVILGTVMLSAMPSAGAYGSDYLRKIIGDDAVAAMETALFQTQDMIKKWEFDLGLAKPDNPFGSTPALVEPTTTPASDNLSAQTVQELPVIENKTAASAVSTPTAQSSPTSVQITPSAASHTAISPSTATTPKPSPTTTWMPAAVDAKSSLPGSDVWQPYITDAAGRVVAYRTFVLPDPTRQYATTAIVAFDLEHIRLHYVIGFDAPYAPGIKKTASGAIPEEDMQAGLLLATFNGGFKYEHGHFGSMADGLVSVPPKEGLGTLVIEPDGSIRIGEWGKDIQPNGNYIAYRQNGPLVIQDGAISAKVDDSLIWGRTISGGTVTWRSGLAISPDNHTLYYIAGPSLSVSSLAAAMETVHPQSAIQLDINNFWVHFTAVRDNQGQLGSDPLFPKAMSSSLDRYLKPYPRDFFYITAAQ